MKRRLLLLSACTAAAFLPVAQAEGASQTGDAQAVTARIPLRYLASKSVAAVIKDMQGIDQLTCDFADNSVTVRGSQKSVDAFKAEIRKADVEPTVYVVRLRLVRFQVDAGGKVTETTVMAPIVSTTDGTPGRISITGPQGSDPSGFAILVDIRHDAEKTMAMLSVEVQQLGERGEVVNSGKNARHMVLGRTARLTGMTDAGDIAIRRKVQNGEIETRRGAYTGYYVEVKPETPTAGGVHSAGQP